MRKERREEREERREKSAERSDKSAERSEKRKTTKITDWRTNGKSSRATLSAATASSSQQQVSLERPCVGYPLPLHVDVWAQSSTSWPPLWTTIYARFLCGWAWVYWPWLLSCCLAALAWFCLDPWPFRLEIRCPLGGAFDTHQL